MKKRVALSGMKCLAVAVAFSVIIACQGTQAAAAGVSTAPNTAKEAMQASKDSNQYLFLLFYDNKDDLLITMEETVNGYTKNSEQKVIFYESSVRDPVNAEIVTKFRLDRAPMPILLVMSPNGAVVGGFPKMVTVENIAKSFAPPLVTDVLKAVQDEKMAVVLVQNGTTKFNAESTKAAEELAYDKNFVGKVEIIKADPSDGKNRAFLSNAKLIGPISLATIVLIAPPGAVAGVYQGNVTKDTIIKDLSSGGACAPGSCAPGSCS